MSARIERQQIFRIDQASTEEKKTMAIEFDGNEIETTATGYLANQDDWSEDLCRHLAAADGIELTDAHWDLINYLRDEYFNNAQSTPNTRTIVKAMSDKWGREIESKEVYDLFPLDPSKQGGRIAGDQGQ